jgi:tetratricopeptide (TPR) repeat protein
VPSSDIGTVYFWLGFNELHQGDLSAAERYFDAVVSRDQQHLPVTDSDLETSELGLAEIYAKRGAFKRSEEAARHVVATTKQGTAYLGAAAHSILGNALLREGKVREAEPELELAYQWFSHDPKIRPHTVEAYQDLSEVEMKLGKPHDAARIREELRTHPR